jgi:hypothetical protein
VKTIQVDLDIYNFLKSKAAQPGASPALVLRRELNVPQPTESIEIDDDTFAVLLSKAASLGESASDILRRELKLVAAPPPDPAGLVVFHIPAGTGTRAWNARGGAIMATVGDTLRIVNDDSVPHRLHTDGIPFPHPGADIPPGQAADYVLQAPFDPIASQPLYDHDAGATALFWITVRPPQ